MISQEMNDKLTLTGPKDPAGKVLRRYWQPAALSDELQVKRPVVPVKLLGEDLVLFRDTSIGTANVSSNQVSPKAPGCTRTSRQKAIRW